MERVQTHILKLIFLSMVLSMLYSHLILTKHVIGTLLPHLFNIILSLHFIKFFPLIFYYEISFSEHNYHRL